MIEQLARAVPGPAHKRGLRLLESCSSIWIFDEASRRFRRVPRGANVSFNVPEQWAEYHDLDIDESRSRFTVTLNRYGTRILRAAFHGDPCPRCQRSTAS